MPGGPGHTGSLSCRLGCRCNAPSHVNVFMGSRQNEQKLRPKGRAEGQSICDSHTAVQQLTNDSMPLNPHDPEGKEGAGPVLRAI